jgi:two-component system, LytTR family, response regulator LytT
MKVIVVEDEAGAADNLLLLLKEIAPQTDVLATLASIEQTVEWLSDHAHPDLAFFDIQLEDGLSFEVFRQVEIDFPVIFTTAFDEYAIEAFKVNSVDYLLKPIKEHDLRFSLDKYKRLNKGNVSHALIRKIIDSMPGPGEGSTFLIHYKDKLIPVADKDFAFFYIDNGLVHGCTHTHQTYPIEHTVEELEAKLNARQFFKANRQFIVNRAAVKEIEFYFNGRLLLRLSPPAKDAVLVSKARVPVFKEWMKG